MTKLCANLVLLLFCFAVNGQAPTAPKHNKALKLHDDKRSDPYYWMREWHSPVVKKYLEDENVYTGNVMLPTKRLQEKIAAEIWNRLGDSAHSVPYIVNGYTYYTRLNKGSQYPVYFRKLNTSASNEELLFDANSLAEGHPFFALSNFGFQISPDNKLLALSIDTNGSGSFVTLFKNIATGTWLKEGLTNTIGDAVFANDNQTIIYTCYDKLYRPAMVKRHRINAHTKDEIIYYEHDKTYDIYVHRSSSGKYIMLRAFGGTSTEYSVLNADSAKASFKLIQRRQIGLEYSVGHSNGSFYILTNYGAANWRIMQSSETATSKENWREILPAYGQGKMFGMEAYNDYLVVQLLINGIEKIQILNLHSGELKDVKFNQDIRSLRFDMAPVSARHDFDNEQLSVYYSSLTTPQCTYGYNMRSSELALIHEHTIEGYNALAYETQRVYATALDSAKVPLTIVYKKGTPLSGTAPLLLSGYGAYGGYDSPRFSASIISLLDRGFVYAIAHVRGGEELGHDWYVQGRQLNKVNTFTDFIACADYLMKHNYTDSIRMFAEGQSAGGLIMGFIANNRPKLFKGLLLDVPFLDVVTTMLGDSYDYTEWGNPKIKSHYDYMLSYSPYDNIKRQDYSGMFITAGYYDQYWDAAKWLAKVREHNTGKAPILLATDFSSGHDGPSGKMGQCKRQALKYAFVLALCGIRE